jgi:DNA-binding transcriptional LysR family regulator
VLRGLPAAAAALRSTEPAGGDHDLAEFVPQVVVNSSEVARRIARASDVIVPGTAAMLHDDVAAGHLVLLPVDAPFMRTVHGVFYLRDRTLAPTARVFIDILMAVEAEVRAAGRGLTNRHRKRRTR